MTDDTRARLMRLLEPNRMGRAPAVKSPPVHPPTEGPAAPVSEAAAGRAESPRPASMDRRIAALRAGGAAWEPAPPPPPPGKTPDTVEVPQTIEVAAPTAAEGSPRAPTPAVGSTAVARLLALQRTIRGGRSSSTAEPKALPETTGAADFELFFPCEPRPTPFGPAWVLTDRLLPEASHGDRTLGAPLTHRASAGAALSVLTGERDMAGFDLAGALFLDLESTGLALAGGTLPFLVGAAHFQGDALVLEQWLLREPDDEAAALSDLAARVAEADWLVTFNGRTFDLPLLRTRWRLHRQPDPSVGLRGHLDLLPVSRRILKHGLPNCRLGTLERHLLGLHRVGDVAGSEVPGCYHAWLHDRNPAPLAGVVRHNRLDVLSMVTLLDEVLGRILRPEATLLRDPECALKLADRARRFEAPDLARRIYEAGRIVPETRAAAEQGLARLERTVRRRPRRTAP